MGKFAPLALVFIAALLLAGIATGVSRGDLGTWDVVGSLMLPGALLLSAVLIWE
jgi:hypothetical protein